MSDLALLHALAAGLCQDARVRIDASDAGWAWSPGQRALLVPPHAVAELGLEAAAGIVAHEIGHALVSRYTLFAEVAAAETVVRLALNTIEDPRVEGFIVRRYPGARRWLAAAQRATAGPPAPVPTLQLLDRFVDEGQIEAGFAPVDAGDAPPALHPDVVAALDATRAARRAYVRDHLPSPRFDDAPSDAAAVYAAEVGPALVEGASPWPPPLAEAWVRLLSHQAWVLARDRIVPAVREVVAADTARVARLVERDASAAKVAQAAVTTRDARLATALAAAATVAAEPGDAPRTEASLALAARVLEVLFGSRQPRVAARAEADVDGTPPALRDDRAGAPPEPSRYARAMAPLERDIAGLAASLEDALRPRRRTRMVSGFGSGRRVDLRAAMAFEADPRLGPRFWERPTVPDRRSAAFQLLVDLSGSMRGEKAKRAVDAVILFAETLARLGVPFAIAGFQDEVVPVLDFDAPFDAAAREAILDLPLETAGRRPGGHNCPGYNDDGPCLRESAAALAARSEIDRVLVVLSDGAPSGCRSGPEDLHTAVAEVQRTGLALVGLGVGPGTEHVGDYYPRAIASVPVEELAVRVGGVVAEVLTRAAG